MKILVFMSDNRVLENSYDAADYNSLVASINYEYCKKHGYDFIYYRPYLNNVNIIELYNCLDPNSGKPRHSAWSKILSTKKALNLNYDYVVYIDSDCIFKNHEKTLESFIEPYLNYDILFLNDKPYSFDRPCSGFYICKVSSHSRKFINAWYNIRIPENNIRHPWEQAALYKIYNYYNIKIIDDWMFKEKPGQLLRHIGSDVKETRIPYFKLFIKNNHIPFSKNIISLDSREFRTHYTVKNKTRKRKI